MTLADALGLVKPGAKLPWDDFSGVRIMAVADGWAMLRRPHAIPFTMGVKEIAVRLMLHPAPPATP